MKEKNLNKNSLSKLLGLSQPAIKKIESGLNLPSFKLLFQILEEFDDISAEWLIRGKGDMYVYKDYEKTISLLSSEYSMLKEEPEDELIECKKMLKDKDKQVSDLIKMNLYLLEREKEGGHTLPESAKEDRSVG